MLVIYRDTPGYDDNLLDLVNAIIEQAVDDYRRIKDPSKGPIGYDSRGMVSEAELKNFFMGPWCERLLAVYKLTGPTILKTLEEEFGGR